MILGIDPLFFSEHVVRRFVQEIKPRIEEYIHAHGNALIPQGYVCNDGYRLGEKIADLRERRTKLTKPILDYFNSLGDKWAWNYFEYLHLQNMLEMITHFEAHSYEQHLLPKKVLELKSKVKKALKKYPASEPFRKRLEELAPGIFD